MDERRWRGGEEGVYEAGFLSEQFVKSLVWDPGCEPANPLLMFLVVGISEK